MLNDICSPYDYDPILYLSLCSSHLNIAFEDTGIYSLTEIKDFEVTETAQEVNRLLWGMSFLYFSGLIIFRVV